MKPRTQAVVNSVSSENYILVIDTSGTKAAPGSSIVNYILSWGDGHTNNGTGPPPVNSTHKYDLEDDYNVSLTIYDSKGGASQDRKSMRVRGPLPIPPTDITYGAGTIVRGPQSSITCPVGAVNIPDGASIQNAINANPNGTTFCIAGNHSITASIVPKTGNTFVGQFGATVDGSGWVTGDNTQAAFRILDQAIDNVTIRNLIIRNMPQRGVQAVGFSPAPRPSNWTVEYCEVYNCVDIGVLLSSGAAVQHNYIHNCGTAYGINKNDTPVDFSYNEITACHGDSKFFESGNPRESANYGTGASGIIHAHHNYIHDCNTAALWNDGGGFNSIFEYNTLDDNLRGIHWELSNTAIHRNNLIRRSTDQAAFLSVSTSEVYNNKFEDNFRAIILFVDCGALGVYPWNPDLINNYCHNNLIYAGSTPGLLTCGLSVSAFPCGIYTSTPYLDNTKSNIFNLNNYFTHVDGSYWFWGPSGGLNFASWQAVPQDVAGTRTFY